MKAFAVILAGGKGERFWPASRRNFPKQFLKLFGQESLIQMTSRRIAPVCPLKHQRFVVDRKLSQVLKRQLKLGERNFIFEPYGRNTAPAIALAAACLAHEEEKDSLMVVLPADHLIKDEEAFQRAVRFAGKVAGQGYLVTFGIPPVRADTNYGYVEAGAVRHEERKLQAFAVRRFREKPGLKQAKQFLRKEGFWWNSGMFVWQTATFLQAVAEFMPGFYQDLVKFQARIGTTGEAQALDNLYHRAEPISVDYAIMEKSPKVAVVKADFDWDDVGSWLALERHFPADANQNVSIGKGIGLDARGCMTLSDAGLVALVGCEDLVVVRAGDAVLVCRKGKAGDVKKLLAQMAEHPEYHEYL